MLSTGTPISCSFAGILLQRCCYVVGFMAYQFNSSEIATKPEHRTLIKKEINTAIGLAESAGAELGNKFPDFEELIIQHGGEVKETDALEKLLAQKDHIGYPKGS